MSFSFLSFTGYQFFTVLTLVFVAFASLTFSWTFFSSLASEFSSL